MVQGLKIVKTEKISGVSGESNSNKRMVTLKRTIVEFYLLTICLYSHLRIIHHNPQF